MVKSINFDVNMTLCKIIAVTLRIIGIVSGIIGNLKEFIIGWCLFSGLSTTGRRGAAWCHGAPGGSYPLIRIGRFAIRRFAFRYPPIEPQLPVNP